MVTISPGSVVLLETVRALRQVLTEQSTQRVDESIVHGRSTPDALADEQDRDTVSLFIWPTAETAVTDAEQRLASWVEAYICVSEPTLSPEGARAIAMTRHVELQRLEEAALHAWSWHCLFAIDLPPLDNPEWHMLMTAYAELGVSAAETQEMIRLAHVPQCRHRCRSLGRK